MVFKRLLFVSLLITALTAGCSSNSAEDAKATPTAAPAPAAAPAGAPKPATTKMADAVPDKPAAPAAPRFVKVPAGTELNVILIDSLSTKTNKAGDTFMASLGSPLVVGGKTIADKGTKVQGRVVDAEGSGRVKGLASIHLVLTGIQDGAKMIPIVTRTFEAQAEATKGRDAAVVGGGSGVGAAIGAVTGGKKGAGVGAIIGGVAGTAGVLATKGKEVEYASETRLTFTLDKDAELPSKGN